MLVVKGIENFKKALTYYDNIKENKNITNGIAPESIKQFMISKSNFITLLKNQKETESYATFFNTNYLKI